MARGAMGPYRGAPTARLVVPGVVAAYLCISGLTSFCSAPVALVLSLIFLLLEAVLANESMGLSQVTHWLLFLWLGTVFVAAVIGTRNYHISFAPYLAAKAGRQYDGIGAFSKASAHADGSIITFSGDARLDDTMSVGLRAQGYTYCVAPVLSLAGAGTLGTPAVQFWAVGLDCCGSRQNFHCDSATEAGAHSGVVLPRPEEDGMDAMARAIFAPSLFHEGYVRAVKASSALHRLQTPDEPVLLRWTSRPEALLSSWLVRALLVWIVSSAVYCIGAVLVWVGIQSMDGRPLLKSSALRSSLKTRNDQQPDVAPHPL
mmetsp:Transcript_76018/g.163158  ORF Transcript_76018/g.163158 Transcript_76018/m.163158 type:complete len:316 (-) Transcript_76018:19-966(-)